MDDVKTNPMATGDRSVGPATLRIRQCNALPSHMRPLTRELRDFTVEKDEQNKGYGARLLRKVCAEADTAGITLVLWAKPYGEDAPLDQAKLVEWYNRFGFAVLQAGDTVMMARMPGAHERGARLSPIAASLIQEFA